MDSSEEQEKDKPKDDNAARSKEEIIDRGPSEAYAVAISKPIYRLSELMFGSLLAAYVLGFIGAVAFASKSPNPSEISFLITLRYLAISLSYVFLTAAMYLSYHFNILANPRFAFARIEGDFVIATSQGVFFGLSIIYPEIYIALLGVNILIASYRQKKEYSEMRDSLYILVPKHFDDDDVTQGVPKRAEKKFDVKLKAELKTASVLKEMLLPPAYNIYILGAIASVGGFLIAVSGVWRYDIIVLTARIDIGDILLLMSSMATLYSSLRAISKKNKFLNSLDQKEKGSDEKIVDLQYKNLKAGIPAFSFNREKESWEKPKVATGATTN